MPKRKYVRVDLGLGQAGVTLIELMVSTGLAGIIMIALMFLLYQSGKLGGVMTGNLTTIEGVADGVALFSGVLPQVTRIQKCLCRGGDTGNSRATCVWDSSSPWYDPVADGAATSPVEILTGEFEAYDGTQASNSMGALATNAINIAGQTCASSSSNMASSMMRGCKLPFKLIYTAPTQVVGSNPSNSGQLQLTMGTGKAAQIGLATPSGSNGLGLTQLACGFDTSTGGTGGSIFVLNMKIKAKTNTILDVTSPNYESWYPSSSCLKNSCRGQSREIQLKYTMRNLITRGVYFWRAQSQKGCIQNGDATTSAAYCCSQAWNGTTCTTCLPAGTAGGSDAACCSGARSGGNCI